MEIPPKPKTSKFQQTKIPAFYPQFSAKFVVSCLFVVAVVFIAIGVAVVVGTDSVVSREVRYDDVNHYTFSSLTDFNISGQPQGAITRVRFHLDRVMSKPVYMYYRITGMYQNFQQFSKSRSYSQLAGQSVSTSDIGSCKPFRGPADLSGESGTVSVNGTLLTLSDMMYTPCGSIAWAMFNDTFALYSVPTAVTIPPRPAPLPVAQLQLVCDGTLFDRDSNPTDGGDQSCSKSGIALSVDRDSRFDNPKLDIKSWSGFGSVNSSNLFHRNGFYNHELGHKLPDPRDEDFMVWMRTASLPDFKKLYRVINVDLQPGDYVLQVTELYDTASFAGKKFMVLSTVSWIGSGDLVLGIAFLVAGAFAFVIGIACLVVNMIKQDSRRSVE